MQFFEEKIRLEREASQKIAELAERAHTEAIAKLDETTRSVYKENIRLNEALTYHIQVRLIDNRGTKMIFQHLSFH